jgi:cytidylate kinase
MRAHTKEGVNTDRRYHHVYQDRGCIGHHHRRRFRGVGGYEVAERSAQSRSARRLQRIRGLRPGLRSNVSNGAALALDHHLLAPLLGELIPEQAADRIDTETDLVYEPKKRDEELTMAVIAMTREIGSLGTDVAAGLAAKLRLRIIRPEVVANCVAERLGVEASAVRRFVDGSATLLERWRIDRGKLLHYTAEEILRAAHEGNVLIKGWGAATLLRDIPQVISVRVCAPIDFRVRVLMDRLGSKDANAIQAQIERFDAAGARTMRAFFNIEQEDVRLYHVVLNTERLSINDCVKTVSELAQNPQFRENATMRSVLANKLTEAKVSLALAEHIGSTRAPLGVSVSVADGKVTLAGMSCDGSLRRRAEMIAHTVAGVSQIDNRIVSVPSRGIRF